MIQVKLDEGEPIITIDAFINNMPSQQKVRLTYTDSYFSQKPNEAITGATVTVKDITAGLTYNFNDNNDGNYTYDINATDTLGRIGHNYELTVLHQGSVYKSTTRMKRSTTIDSRRW